MQNLPPFLSTRRMEQEELIAVAYSWVSESGDNESNIALLVFLLLWQNPTVTVQGRRVYFSLWFKVQPVHLCGEDAVEAWGSPLLCACSGEAERRVMLLTSLLSFSVLFHVDLHPMGWCCVCSLPSSVKPLELTWKACSEVCLLGDSNFSQLDNEDYPLFLPIVDRYLEMTSSEM